MLPGDRERVGVYILPDAGARSAIVRAKAKSGESFADAERDIAVRTCHVVFHAPPALRNLVCKGGGGE